jgi:ATP/maltotriose-dependent transcriptional regulator MalT
VTPDRPRSPLLAVKHEIPRVRTAVVSRTRLEERLGVATKRMVVAAPAGWGKTSRGACAAKVIGRPRWTSRWPAS